MHSPFYTGGRRGRWAAIASICIFGGCTEGTAPFDVDDPLGPEGSTELVTAAAHLAPAPEVLEAPTQTTCINSDGPGGRETYALLESILGDNCVENPDNDHSPPFKHVKEASDDEVGNHFVFYSHLDIDSDRGTRVDRQRIEIKVNGGADEDLKGKPGKTMTYTWRFKINPGMTFASSFTHMFQMKSFGGNADAPLITISGRENGGKESLRVDYQGDDSGRTLGQVSLNGLKNVWLSVHVRAQISQSGNFSLTIKKPNGDTVLSINEGGLDLWRQGEYIRPKWGIYRKLNDSLRSAEETVRFANFAITPGATPSSDCE
jgi:hypothetical protein